MISDLRVSICVEMTRTSTQSEIVSIIHTLQHLLVKYSTTVRLRRRKYEPGSVALIFMSRSSTGVELFRIQRLMGNSQPHDYYLINGN